MNTCIGILTLALVALFHQAHTADILTGRLMFKNGKCVNVDAEMLLEMNDAGAGCSMVNLMSVDAGGYMMKIGDEKFLLSGLDEFSAHLDADGTAVMFSKDGTPITGVTTDDVSAITNMDSPFHILLQAATAGATAECLDGLLAYVLKTEADSTACDGMTWYFKLADCTDDNCMRCNMGEAECTHCNAMYALNTDKTCQPCTGADVNCTACAYSTAATPVLECSACKEDYELHDDKSCKAKEEDDDDDNDDDDDDNSGVVMAVSPLAVMVTVILGIFRVQY